MICFYEQTMNFVEVGFMFMFLSFKCAWLQLERHRTLTLSTTVSEVQTTEVVAVWAQIQSCANHAKFSVVKIPPRSGNNSFSCFHICLRHTKRWNYFILHHRKKKFFFLLFIVTLFTPKACEKFNFFFVRIKIVSLFRNIAKVVFKG